MLVLLLFYCFTSLFLQSGASGAIGASAVRAVKVVPDIGVGNAPRGSSALGVRWRRSPATSMSHVICTQNSVPLII